MNHAVQDVGSFVMPREIGVYLEGENVPALVEDVEIGGDAHRFVILLSGEREDVRLDLNTWAPFRSDFGGRPSSGG